MFADTGGSLRGTVTYTSLVSVIDHFRASSWPADIVAVTGDLIQDDSAEAYAHFRRLLEPLGLPVHCLPGNHDVRALMQQYLDAPPFYYCESTEIGNWLIVGIDSCESGRAGGAVDERELDRLESAIEGSDAEHVMICLHHPPVPMGSAWLDTVGLDNPDAFMACAARSGRVRLVIFGHVHQVYDREHDGIRIVATPSTCRQFLPGSEDFAVDNRPPAYRKISLHRDGTVDADLVWLDDA